MFNNESQFEDIENWMELSYSLEKIPLYEISRFNNDEFNFTCKEDIINNITPLNQLVFNKNENIEDSDYINANTREKSNIFKVTIKNTKLGRKKKIENKNFTDSGHNKYNTDNIITKIKVHSISFIFIFVNIILQKLGYKERFYKIKYSFKSKVTKKNLTELKASNVGYILSQEKSSKYKKDKEENKVIYEHLKNFPILRKIFSYNYIDFFNNFYCKEDNYINLNEFDSSINININLYKYGAKMYKDLKAKNINDPEYVQKLDEIINNIFKRE